MLTVHSKSIRGDHDPESISQGRTISDTIRLQGEHGKNSHACSAKYRLVKTKTKIITVQGTTAVR